MERSRAASRDMVVAGRVALTKPHQSQPAIGVDWRQRMAMEFFLGRSRSYLWLGTHQGL